MTIKNRHQYLTSRDGWFVPAGSNLDRYGAMKKVCLSYNEKWIKVINGYSFPVVGVTLLAPLGLKSMLISKNGIEYKPNQENEIVIERLWSFETLSLLAQSK